jgi:catechol 2,3-dioxygenase-like lactoylglutathione lyase family enzyme
VEALNHLDLNVSDLGRSEAFYRDVLGRLGYGERERGAGWVSIGVRDFYVTLVQTDERFLDRGFHRKGVGVNHLSFRAPTREAVDDLDRWLVDRDVPVLYDGPMEMGTPEDPNYAVFFEDPDRLKLEYVFRG